MIRIVIDRSNRTLLDMQAHQIGVRLNEGSLSGASLSAGRRSLTRPARPNLVIRSQGVAFVKDAVTGGNGKHGSQSVRLEEDGQGIEYDIVRKANYVVGSEDLDPQAAYRATALSVREHLIDAFNKTQRYWR